MNVKVCLDVQSMPSHLIKLLYLDINILNVHVFALYQ